MNVIVCPDASLRIVGVLHADRREQLLLGVVGRVHARRHLEHRDSVWMAELL